MNGAFAVIDPRFPVHGTTEQAHRLVHKIQEDFHHKRYCTATFIDISQAFDKVWHPGLLHKLKRVLPHPLNSILKSYLTNRVFQVRYQEECTSLHTVHSGVYSKGVSLAPSYTPSSLPTYVSPTKHSQPPTQTIRQYWHHTPIPSRQPDTSRYIWINLNTG